MNNFKFFFDPVFPLWSVLVGAVLLTVFLFWKEIKRNQKFLGLRLAAQFLMLLAILGIVLRPGMIQNKTSAGILLLTPNFSKPTVDSLLRQYPGTRLIHVTGTDSYRSSEEFQSHHQLSTVGPEIQFICGVGLPSYALESIEEKKFTFLSSPPPTGITKLQLPENVEANKKSLVQGVVTSKSNAMLVLSGPGGKLDSLLCQASATTPFTLKFTPKQPGKFIYQLQYRDQAGTTTEQLPIEVKEEQKLKILMLQKFPSFEVRQLKNFLAEKGHVLALRYQVSKNNYRFEFANTPPHRLSPLTTSVFQATDLVIIDSDGLEALSSNEKKSLEQSIQEGLGLIVLLNRSIKKDMVFNQFMPLQLKQITKDTAQIKLENKTYTLPMLPLTINDYSSVFPVTKNKTGIMSGYVFIGQGKGGFQFLQETYRIALEGNPQDYASLWSPLIEKIARTKSDKFKIRLLNNFPVYPDEPLAIEITATTNEHPSLLDGTSALPVSEHVAIDNVWHGESWAGEPGWHQLAAGSTAYNYFISEPTAWKSIRTVQQLQENRSASVQHTGTPESKIPAKEKIPAVIFFTIFLFAAGFLWLAPKI